MPGVSPTNNPNWRNDAGLPPKPKCRCGHPTDSHPDVQRGRGCHATLYVNHNPWVSGPCQECDCMVFEPFDLKVP
jgi:hypothetical protein